MSSNAVAAIDKSDEGGEVMVNSNSYQVQFKQTWFGIVLMFRCAIPANGYGDREWGKWRKAKWSDMYLYTKG